MAGLGKNVAGGVVGLGKNVAIGVAATPGMVASTVVDTVDTVSYVAARKDETTAELARLTDEVATLKRRVATAPPRGTRVGCPCPSANMDEHSAARPLIRFAGCLRLR